MFWEINLSFMLFQRVRNNVNTATMEDLWLKKLKAFSAKREQRYPMPVEEGILALKPSIDGHVSNEEGHFLSNIAASQAKHEFRSGTLARKLHLLVEY